MKKAFYEKHIGQTLPVLFEQQKKGLWIGMTENYMEIRIKSDEDLKSKTIMCEILAYNAEEEYLHAKIK